MREINPPSPDSPAGDDDPWAFVTARKPQKSLPIPDTAADGIVPEPIAALGSRLEDAGSLSAMQALRLRGRPMAWALTATFFVGCLTEIVASARLVSLLGPTALVIIFILGGFALIFSAILQMTWIDRIRRDNALVRITIIYVVLFVLALVLTAYQPTTLWGNGLIVLLSDQLLFLLPFIIWAIVGDLFNAGEGRRVYPWITSWQYGGEISGLALAAIAPLFFVPLQLPLWSVLIICPVILVLIPILLPRALTGRVISRGHGRDESLRTSMKSTWEFVGGIKAFHALLIASILVFAAGLTLEASFLTSGDRILGDEAKLQMLYGGTAVIVYTTCAILQKFYMTRIVERLNIPGSLAVLPMAAIVASLLIMTALLAGQFVPLLMIGIIAWWIPRWSISEVARHAALAVVPDEKRARVSFMVGVVPVALGLILAGLITWLVAWLGWPVLAPVIALGFAAVALIPARAMVRAWSDALLDPRLRRRKRLSS